MGFNKYQHHCTQCKRGKPCGKKHVYALELDPAILKETWFRELNPDYVEGKACVYVGRTSRHVPRCRASGHQHCKRGAWKGETYLCYCKGKGERISCTLGSRGAIKKVDKYNTCGLKKNLFRRYNPQENERDNKGMERFLANHLRARGHGVYAGHLDGDGDSDDEEEQDGDSDIPQSFLDAISEATG